ncbi:DUF2180 family protein [Streptomyces sp. NPDC090442]|uniref:DUF2180 family protein n=1 Tax=Streptomyces sp. NPDC090442 TaxID=3365962 RepID=UPI003828A9F6
MHCFDCAALGRETVAVALCQGCGAGQCSAHVIVAQRAVRRLAGLGQVSSPDPARRMTCAACHGASRTA